MRKIVALLQQVTSVISWNKSTFKHMHFLSKKSTIRWHIRIIFYYANPVLTATSSHVARDTFLSYDFHSTTQARIDNGITTIICSNGIDNNDDSNDYSNDNRYYCIMI